MTRYLALGDGAMTVEFGIDISPELNARVRAFYRALRDGPLPGMLDAMPTYRSVTVQFDPLHPETERMEERLRQVGARAERLALPPGRVHTIPVHYGGEDGPDLADVAALHDTTAEDVVARHANREYLVYCVGFSPGFALLGGLPEELTTPRLGTPRKLVPAGTVGIGGQQTGVYPVPTPGGWRLLGRTNFMFFDVSRQPPCPIEPGDRILFRPVEQLESGQNTHIRTPEVDPAVPVLQVIEPGLFTTVQDAGRWGYQAYGVNVAGAMDGASLQLANLAVGNPADAACLEMTLFGPTLRAVAECTVAVVGATMDLKLNGRGMPSNEPVRLHPGDELTTGQPLRGARTYLSVQGGIDVPPVLGSRATYVRAGMGGLGGRTLRAGDSLGVVPHERSSSPRRVPAPPLPKSGENVVVRVVLGPQDDHFSAKTIREFLSAPFLISNDADRMGYRLSGHVLRHVGPAEVVTDGLVFGSIQVPGHGNPIIMLADRGTVGGYPKIATIITADVRLVAQCLPGTRLRFEAVSAEEGRRIARQQHDELFGQPSHSDDLGGLLSWAGALE